MTFKPGFQKKDSDLVKVAGFWKKESKSGNKYFSGKLTQEGKDAIANAKVGDSLMLFLGRPDRKENAPDLNLNVAPARESAAPAQKPSERDDFAGL